MVRHVRHLVDPGIQPVLMHRLVLTGFIYNSVSLNVHLHSALCLLYINLLSHHIYRLFST